MAHGSLVSNCSDMYELTFYEFEFFQYFHVRLIAVWMGIFDNTFHSYSEILMLFTVMVILLQF